MSNYTKGPWEASEYLKGLLINSITELHNDYAGCGSEYDLPALMDVVTNMKAAAELVAMTEEEWRETIDDAVRIYGPLPNEAGEFMAMPWET